MWSLFCRQERLIDAAADEEHHKEGPESKANIYKRRVIVIYEKDC